MANHVLQEKDKPSYKSDNMYASENTVKGSCYLVQVSGNDLGTTQNLRLTAADSVRMTAIELEANMKLGTVQVQKSGTKLVDKYTFSEVMMAESTDYLIQDVALKANRVHRNFTHSFKVSF